MFPHQAHSNVMWLKNDILKGRGKGFHIRKAMLRRITLTTLRKIILLSRYIQYNFELTVSLTAVKKQKVTKKQVKRLPKNKIFPFLSLPPELRNKIYEECLLDASYNLDGEEVPGMWLGNKQQAYRRGVERLIPEPADWDDEDRTHSICCSRGYWHHQRNQDQDRDDIEQPERAMNVNLLATCKQINSEANALFYGQRLIFTNYTALTGFVSGLTPKTASMLRHIEIRCYALSRTRKNMGFTAMSLLAAKGAVNIKLLHLNCRIGWFGLSHSRRDPPTEKAIADMLKRVGRKVFRDVYPWLDAVMASQPKVKGGVGKVIERISIGKENFEIWQNCMSKDLEKQEDLDLALFGAREEIMKLSRLKK